MLMSCCWFLEVKEAARLDRPTLDRYQTVCRRAAELRVLLRRHLDLGVLFPLRVPVGGRTLRWLVNL